MQQGIRRADRTGIHGERSSEDLGDTGRYSVPANMPDRNTLRTTNMSKFRLFSDPYELGPGRCAQIWTVDITTGETSLLHTSFDVHLEAPNWALDGKTLILSGNGKFWSIDAVGGDLKAIPVDDLPPVTNDHVLEADGRTLLVTALDGQIYRVPLTGGTAVPVTRAPDLSHFLHGISPDQMSLAYVEFPFPDFSRPSELVVMSVDGTDRRVLATGEGHCDGPEFTPDGEWILLNSEAFSDVPGHAQIARIRPDGSGFERLVESERVDWFPHISPDGELASYLSYPEGTLGHPADLPVVIKVVRTSDWSRPFMEIDLFGGQGTINVNSWDPTGTKFAFVAFPTDPSGEPISRLYDSSRQPDPAPSK
ncbi:biopolymer transporter Tol [Arthrobacter bambusae]|uniref:TolB family protein n=1 Tax=Arthrobacter bambusae TaxID=1338426 RepID=UPI001F50F001|nr:biopolymer transporter Tol [Arthrobacter bambusae]MCI0143903.1 biopolymer transporter Tol [Arthrobacter bambusae]